MRARTRGLAAVAAAAGPLGLLPVGGTTTVLGAVGLAGLAASLVAGRTRLGDASAWSLANGVAAALAAVLPLALGIDWAEVATGLVLYLLVHRATTGSSARELRVVLLLGLMLLLLAASRTASPVVGGAFVLFTALAPAALLELGAEEAASRAGRARIGRHPALTAAVAGVVVALAMGTFLVLPRGQAFGVLGQATTRSMAGFRQEVTLGELGEILDDPTPVARVHFPAGVPPAPRLQGITLERFDGRRWRRRHVSEGLAPRGPEALDGAGLIRQEVELLVPTGGPLFALPTAVAGDADGHLLMLDRLGNLRQQDQRGPVTRYVAWSLPPGGAPPGRLGREGRAALTRLPRDLDPRVRELARELTGGGGSEEEKADILEGWLRAGFTYSATPVGSPEAPLESFLFDTRAGHCEYFATALAVLLRAVDVPAVVVNGFAGGELDPVTGHWLVRQRDAHSWVLAWSDGAGWAVRDATPGGGTPEVRAVGWDEGLADLRVWWSQEVVRRGGGPSSMALLWLGAVLAAVLAALAAARGAAAWRRRPGPVTAALHRGWRVARRRGWRAPEGLPPLDAARWVARSAGAGAQPLETLVWLHYRCAYAGEGEEALAAEAGRALRAVRRELPRRRRGA